MDLLPKVERYYKFGKVKFAKDYYIKFYLFFFSKVTDMLHECVSDFIGELSIEQAEDIKHETCQFHEGIERLLQQTVQRVINWCV